MSKNNDKKVREFHVETTFQEMARRPGGLPRDQALKRAESNIDAFKPTFAAWLNEQLDELLGAIPDNESAEFEQSEWIYTADKYSQYLADVAATMDYQFVSLVTNNLCMIFEVIKRGAERNGEIITCHIDALRLARRQDYRGLRPEDLPELSEGLRRVLDSPRLQPQIDGDKL